MNEKLKEELREEAKRFNSRKSFKAGASRSYNLAVKHKIMAEICEHMSTPTRPLSAQFPVVSGIAGVYCLLQGDQVVYIGKSLNCMRMRIVAHLREPLKDFDNVKCYQINNDADTTIVEAYLIALNNPIYNVDHRAKDKATLKLPTINDVIVKEYQYSFES